MMPTNHRLIRCCLGLILLSLGLVACGKDNPAADPPDAGKVSQPEFLEGNPGKYRMELLWGVSAPEVERSVVKWNNGRDLVEVSVGEATSDTLSVVLTDLQEGNQAFNVTLFDEAGGSSKPMRLVARVYGDDYEQSLLPRRILGAMFTEGNVEIEWGAPEQTALHTEVIYTDQSGAERQVSAPRDTEHSTLEEYKAGTFFSYRTAYLPEPAALDTFYSEPATSESLSQKTTFTNPLLPKGADPWVIYRDGMYYYTYTQGGGITLYATSKMSELGEATPVEVWRPPSGTAYSRNLWAPELHFIDGKWYVYFAADDGDDANHRMYVIENATADPMSDNWEFKGKIAEPVDQWAIDHTVLQHNGNMYLLWSGKQSGGFPQSIYIAPMSNPWTIEGSRIRISTPTYAWEKNGAAINEGPQVLINPQGRVFVVFSGSGFWSDDYALGLLSLREGGNPLDPSDWTKKSTPVFTRNDQAGAYGPGHNGFFKSRDGLEDWIIYHAREIPDAATTSPRNPRMQKFTWNANGTPDFGEPVPIGQPVAAPSGEF